MSMFRLIPHAACLFGLALPAFGQPDKAAKQDTARSEDLVKQLGSDVFLEREQAQKQLGTIGESALPALYQALESADLETRRRASVLIARIEAPLFARRMLLPKPVHLKVTDASVNQAIQELARLSGYELVLAEDPLRLANKKLTLDTGKTTFWQAFDQLCAAAGLMERNELNEDTLYQTDAQGVRTRIEETPPDADSMKPRAILMVQRDRWGNPHGVFYAGSVKIEVWTEPDADRKGSVVQFIISAEPRLIGATLLDWPVIHEALDEKKRKVPFTTEAPDALRDLQRQLHETIVSGKSYSRMGISLQGRRFGQIYVPDRAGAEYLKNFSGSLRFQADAILEGARSPRAVTIEFRLEDVWLR